METLPLIYPNVADLLATPPEDLAPILLAFAREAMKRQNGMFDPNYVNELALGEHDRTPQARQYSNREHKDARLHLAEAWSIIESERLIMPSPDMNGAHGYKVFTQPGREISDAVDLKKFRDAGAFPKSLLHPLIADKVWNALMRGDLGEAVSIAFKAVEEEARAAAGLTNADFGANLVKRAFDPTNGPLTDQNELPNERKALLDLFAGAMGYFRNPNAHRSVPMTLQDAQDQVMLGSQLLRKIDSRRTP